jgi:hypothetical protein
MISVDLICEKGPHWKSWTANRMLPGVPRRGDTFYVVNDKGRGIFIISDVAWREGGVAVIIRPARGFVGTVQCDEILKASRWTAVES